MPSPIAELLDSVGRAFGPLRWYLFGAQAAILHGASRLTADVDVTVDPGPRATAELVENLRREGFELRIRDDEFVARTRVLPMIHEPTRILCDVVLAGPGIEEMFFERTEVQSLDGVPVPVVAADDLVAMKVLAGREKDLADVRALVRVQGEHLNRERARATLRLLEQLLDRRDLLPVLDTILDRSRPSR